jgi:hypothetical protein
VNFALITACPQGYAHAGAYAEVSDSLHFGLLQLGHHSTQAVNTLFADARNIVLGAHLLGPADELPEDVVLVNLEQLQDNPNLPDHYTDMLLRHAVWDYSAANVQLLRARGATRVTHLPLGAVPELTRIAAAPKDIDILFYGSLNPRRLAVLDRLAAAGARVEKLFGVYGAARDAFISRANIVLNMHFYDSKVLEVVRILYLLANRAFVVSERGADPLEAQRFEGGLAFCDYDQLVETCMRYLGDQPARDAIAASGQQCVASQPQAAYLRPAIAALVQA